MRGKRKREHSRWPTVQIPLDLFVYIAASLLVSPLLFPSPSSILSACASNTNTHMLQPLHTADAYTDSLNHQIVSLPLNRNGTPTAVTCVRVNYSIANDEKRASCSTMFTPSARCKTDSRQGKR